ncbi:cell wall-active antibiotics response protein LiaF [Litchfieldia salsa]|uniref:Lia operon protein LiaF n=1 Tax=Litchfieldia salsa TaxID=930152 RepID=A0A1H0VWT7_9BACI|nr:cell wall-active antibiotics response protein LiaF [Litchfieldia salsa]SDP82658.1 lia operon protein LiaF [Litchfieldia salsa]
MLPFKNDDFRSWIAMLAIVIIIIEVTFFNNGVMFSALISCLCIYFGINKYHRTIGKVVFWFGLVTIAVTILSSNAFKFLLLTIILYCAYQYFKSRKNPNQIEPVLDSSILENEPLLRKQPLFSNKLFGQIETPDHVYEWNDITLQLGIGDTVIDLSNTVLPDGESVIVIRNFAGNIKIKVPYELEVMINHSALIGTTSVFQHQEPRAYNQVITYQTVDYLTATQKIKIVTSMFYGDLEVKRV